MKQALGIAAAALVIALGTGAIVLRAFLSKGLMPESGTVRIEGLIAPVKVIRDRAGIPHIFARNPNDLLRALGYVEAQDRLFQMEMKRRLAEGELAEVFGPDQIESDYVYRLLDAQRFARESLATYPPDAREQLDVFVAGNQRLHRQPP